jgi:hypothetical protein
VRGHLIPETGCGLNIQDHRRGTRLPKLGLSELDFPNVEAVIWADPVARRSGGRGAIADGNARRTADTPRLVCRD